MKKNILSVLSLCLVILSCSKDDEDSLPLINLEQTEASFSNETGTLTIPFESNANWTAEWSESWLNVYPSKGDASIKSITFTLDRNETYDERSSIVTITAGGLTKDITIDQAAKSGLLLTDDDKIHKLSNDASTIEVEVKANVEFDVTISDEWITQVATRALSSTILKFDIAANESYDNREGTITIKQKDGALESIITVYQSQEDAIILSEKIVNLSSDAEKLEVELQTNIDFEVIIPKDAESWVSYTPSTRALRTETLLLDIGANLSFEDRTTEVYIKNKETSLQETLTINQSGIIGFSLSQNEFDLTFEATTIDVEVITNMEFNVSISDEWITQVTTRSVPSTMLKFDVAKNESFDNREGSITITQKDGDLSSIITVYQSQEDVIILSEKTIELSDADQALEVELQTNVDFEVIIPGDARSWVSYTPATRALTDETLVLNIAENKGFGVRTADIYIKDKASSLQETLTIKQAGKDVEVITVDEEGTLGTILTQSQKENISAIKLKGVIDLADFKVMRNNMPNLTYVDLTDVTPRNRMIPNDALGGFNMQANQNINTVILPIECDLINIGAFGYMLGLKNVIFPEGMTLKELKTQAFWNTPNLVGTLTIPSGVTDIGKQAFKHSEKLDAVRFSHTTPLPYPPLQGKDRWVPVNVTIEVPESAVAAYKAAAYWKDHPIIGY